MHGGCGVYSPSDGFPDPLDSAPMSTILLIGSDTPLLEGLAQTLAAVGHLPMIAGSLGDAAEVAHPAPPLPPALQRLVLADVTLPLERKRLVALVQHVTERAQATGRGPVHTPPGRQAPFGGWESRS